MAVKPQIAPAKPSVSESTDFEAALQRLRSGKPGAAAISKKADAGSTGLRPSDATALIPFVGGGLHGAIHPAEGGSS